MYVIPSIKRKQKGREETNLISTSFRVTASCTINRIHGGGVIGRLSCRLPCCLSHGYLFLFPPPPSRSERSRSHTLSPNPHMRARTGCWMTSRLSHVLPSVPGPGHDDSVKKCGGMWGGVIIRTCISVHCPCCWWGLERVGIAAWWG